MPKKKKNKPEPKSCGEYVVGQEVFFTCVSDQKLGYGRICDFHLGCTNLDNPEETIDCASIVCYMRGSFQTSYLSDIIKDPTKKQIEQRNAAMASLGKSMRQKRK